MAGAKLSRGAVIGLVVDLVVGFLMAFLALCARRAILRRMRDSYQVHILCTLEIETVASQMKPLHVNRGI